MIRIWNPPRPWPEPLPRKCKSRPFRGCLGLAMMKRRQCGSDDAVLIVSNWSVCGSRLPQNRIRAHTDKDFVCMSFS